MTIYLALVLPRSKEGQFRILGAYSTLAAAAVRILNWDDGCVRTFELNVDVPTDRPA